MTWSTLLPAWGWGLAGGLLGAVIGSYLATLVVRWPRGEAARGRSACDGCRRVLHAAELVPLLSFVAARGRCATCDTRIDARHPAVEALCAAVGATTLWLAPGAVGLAGAVFGWLLVTLAVLDLEHYWLPDRITAALALAGAGAGLAGLPPPLADRAIGGSAGFGSLALVAVGYRMLRGRDGLGAGDAKLFGAIGLWLGWRALPIVLLGASVAGIAALIALRIAGRTVRADARVPLGTLLAIAGVAMWLAMATGLAPI